MGDSTVMGARAASQVNARIASDLKRRGDQGLARAGLTPTQAVRALWDLASRSIDCPSRVVEALFPERAEDERAQAEAGIRRKLQAVQDGPKIVERGLEQMGLRPQFDALPSASSNAELRAYAYAERFDDGEALL